MEEDAAGLKAPTFRLPVGLANDGLRVSAAWGGVAPVRFSRGSVK